MAKHQKRLSTAAAGWRGSKKFGGAASPANLAPGTGFLSLLGAPGVGQGPGANAGGAEGGLVSAEAERLAVGFGAGRWRPDMGQLRAAGPAWTGESKNRSTSSIRVVRR